MKETASDCMRARAPRICKPRQFHWVHFLVANECRRHAACHRMLLCGLWITSARDVVYENHERWSRPVLVVMGCSVYRPVNIHVGIWSSRVSAGLLAGTEGRCLWT